MEEKENPDQRDRIDFLLERKMKNIAELTEKKKIDHTYKNKLQGQITQAQNKIADINHRYNLLEQKYKQVDEKHQKLVENNKLLSEELDKKEKEMKNLSIKLSYALKEKNTAEEKLKENKGYINKLEQRILKQNKFTPPKLSTIETDATKLIIETEENGIRWSYDQMSQIIENQKYEIKLLTQTLQEKEQLETTLKTYGNNFRSSYDQRQDTLNCNENQFDKLSVDHHTLLSNFQETQALLAKDKEDKGQEDNAREEKYRDMWEEIDVLKKKNEKIEKEKDSLYKYVDELNKKIRLLTDENIKLQSGFEGTKLKKTNEQDKLLRDIESKDFEMKQLQKSLSQEREKVEDLNKKIESLFEERKFLLEEQNKARKISEINELVKQEILKLQQFIKESQIELEFYREENEKLKKDKDTLRSGLEEFIRRNSTIQQSLEFEGSPDFNCIKTSKLLDELDKLEIEKKKLKDTLQQALNELDDMKVKEKEHEQTYQLKEKQIQNLLNSRNIMQNTLGDQVLSKEKENKKLKEELSKQKEDLKELTEENKFLRELLKKQEKCINEYSSARKSK